MGKFDQSNNSGNQNINNTDRSVNINQTEKPVIITGDNNSVTYTNSVSNIKLKKAKAARESQKKLLDRAKNYIKDGQFDSAKGLLSQNIAYYYDKLSYVPDWSEREKLVDDIEDEVGEAEIEKDAEQRLKLFDYFFRIKHDDLGAEQSALIYGLNGLVEELEQERAKQQKVVYGRIRKSKISSAIVFFILLLISGSLLVRYLPANLDEPVSLSSEFLILLVFSAFVAIKVILNIRAPRQSYVLSVVDSMLHHQLTIFKERARNIYVDVIGDFQSIIPPIYWRTDFDKAKDTIREKVVATQNRSKTIMFTGGVVGLILVSYGSFWSVPPGLLILVAVYLMNRKKLKSSFIEEETDNAFVAEIKKSMVNSGESESGSQQLISINDFIVETKVLINNYQEEIRKLESQLPKPPNVEFVMSAFTQFREKLKKKAQNETGVTVNMAGAGHGDSSSGNIWGFYAPAKYFIKDFDKRFKQKMRNYLHASATGEYHSREMKLNALYSVKFLIFTPDSLILFTFVADLVNDKIYEKKVQRVNYPEIVQVTPSQETIIDANDQVHDVPALNITLTSKETLKLKYRYIDSTLPDSREDTNMFMDEMESDGDVPVLAEEVIKRIQERVHSVNK